GVLPPGLGWLPWLEAYSFSPVKSAIPCPLERVLRGAEFPPSVSTRSGALKCEAADGRASEAVWTTGALRSSPRPRTRWTSRPLAHFSKLCHAASVAGSEVPHALCGRSRARGGGRLAGRSEGDARRGRFRRDEGRGAARRGGAGLAHARGPARAARAAR